jgi:hypothetical protein
MLLQPRRPNRWQKTHRSTENRAPSPPQKLDVVRERTGFQAKRIRQVPRVLNPTGRMDRSHRSRFFFLFNSIVMFFSRALRVCHSHLPQHGCDVMLIGQRASENGPWTANSSDVFPVRQRKGTGCLPRKLGSPPLFFLQILTAAAETALRTAIMQKPQIIEKIARIIGILV